MGRGGVESGREALDLVLGPEFEVLSCDPRLLIFLGWTDSALPVDLDALGAPSLPSNPCNGSLILVAAALQQSSGISELRSNPIERWSVSPLLTRGGPGWRLRYLPPPAEVASTRRLEPSEVWGRAVAHQLRNHHTVVVTSLYGLTDDSAGTPASSDPTSHERCIELASKGIGRSVALLESFTSLAFPDSTQEVPTVEDCFRWFETLFEPRARRRLAKVSVDAGKAAAATLDGQAAGNALSAVSLAALPRMAAERSLRLEARLRGVLEVEFWVSIEGGGETDIRLLREELLRWIAIEAECGGAPSPGACCLVLQRVRGGHA